MLTILGFAGITLFDFAVFNRFWSIINVKKESATQTAQSRLPLSSIEDETETGIKHPTPINEANKEPETQTPPQQTDADETKKLEFSRLIGILTDLGYRLTKLAFIRDNSDSLPDSLSLDELHLLLALFSYRSDRLTVIEIFLSRLKDDYSESDFDTYKKHFSYNSDRKQAIKLLLRKNQTQ